MFITRRELYSIRDGRAPREAVVLVQVDARIGEFGHLKSPEKVRDGEEDLALGQRHPRTDSTAVIPRDNA